MSFQEQKNSCPNCLMQIEITSILIDERATVRIVGECPNPLCMVEEITRDIDPLQIAAEASLKRIKPKNATFLQSGFGH